jgi:hypothetical protein
VYYNYSYRECTNSRSDSHRNHYGLLSVGFPGFRDLWPVQVRLQGDMAKPVDKRLNYKHCFDGLFRVSLTPQTHSCLV